MVVFLVRSSPITRKALTLRGIQSSLTYELTFMVHFCQTIVGDVHVCKLAIYISQFQYHIVSSLFLAHDQCNPKYGAGNSFTVVFLVCPGSFLAHIASGVALQVLVQLFTSIREFMAKDLLRLF